MATNRKPAKKAILALFVLLLAAGFAGAQDHGRSRDRAPVRAVEQDYHKFSLSMGAGTGFAEGHRGLLDLKAEFQIGLTPRLRLGLGVGYLNDHGGRGMDGRDGRDARGMMRGGPGPRFGQADEPGVRARLMPVSLNLYYGLPVGRKWTVFMSGGGSWYRGTFEGPLGDERHNSWGAQAGLGLQFRIAPGLELVAEAGYRFVEFHDVATQVNLPLLMLENAIDEIVRKSPAVAEFLSGALVPLAPKPVRRSDVNLGGMSVRMGVKFGL